MFRKQKFGGFTVAGVRRKEEKNRGVQLAATIFVGLVFFGPLLARVLHWHMTIAVLGAALVVDLVLLIAIALWAVRRWNY